MSNPDVEILRDYEALLCGRATTKDPRWVTLPNIALAHQPSRFKG